jgi:protein O-GlcNAc transferase
MAPVDLTLSEALGQAMAAHEAGNLGEAARLYTGIIDRNGQRPDVLHQLAIIEYQRGRPAIAVSLIDAALALRPDYAEALVSRGNILCALDSPQQALACYDQALSINPDYPEALYNQGCALQMLGRQDDALANYDRALAINPKFAEVFNNRGNLLYATGRFAQALESYDRALAIKSGDAAVLNNRGSALYALDRWQEALDSYDRALTIEADYFDALYNRGNVLREMNLWRGAVKSYATALTIRPDHAAAKFALCIAELPILYADTAEIAERRAAYAERLTALCHAVDGIEAPGDLAGAVGAHRPYYLAYQGYNDRDLHARYGALVCRIMAAHYPPAPLAAPPPGPDEPVRVGVVSGYFRLHSNWKLHSKALCGQLDRARFRVFGYHTGSEQDDETKIAAAMCDRFVQGPLSVEAWRQAIVADAPHVLIYPEIGMDPACVALAAQRLAPVQCNSYGNPDTSGFPTVDYYLSSDLMEPPDGQDHYTERLIRLPNLAAYYEPFDVPAVALGRAELGLRPAATVYWCGQSLYKYLPQFDSVFARIARGAAGCQFVFIEHPVSHVTALFKQRLERAFAAAGLRADDYCVILPRLDFPRFVAVFGLCDVFLDSIGWSGANTTLESLAHPMPVVTLAAPLMRGRHTLAILKMLGVTETITETVDDYIAVAIRLARDAPWRMAVQQRMSANAHKVYRDRTWISALEELLNRVAREGIGSAR